MQISNNILTFSLAIDLSTIVLCLVGGLLVLQGHPNVNIVNRKHWLMLFVCLFIYAVAIMLGLQLRGYEGPNVRMILYIANYLEFAMPSILVYIVTIHLLSILDPNKEWKKLRTVLPLMVAVHIAALTASQFSDLFYIIDAQNYYQRSLWYPLSYLMSLAIMMIDLYLMIRYRRRMTRQQRIAFGIYIIAPAIAAIIQMFIYGIQLIEFAMGIACLALVSFIIMDQTEHYYKQRQENISLKTDILIAQIRPHFLYNSLLVIQQVCLQDPKKASEAIGDFLRYLRHNMESISKDTPIMFIDELNHVRYYIALQQLRFGDDLQIVYDLGCQDFRMPALTLQPLVENAVRYGIRKNEDGQGTVTVATRDIGDHYEVSVRDDGPGFDPQVIEYGAQPDTQSQEETRVGIGLVNVRRRIEMICGGDLKIDSAPGKGTIMTILLPKSEQTEIQKEGM